MAAAHAALLLVLWPALRQPFSTPKGAVLAACGVLALLASFARPGAQRSGAVPALAVGWLAVLTCAALLAPAPDPLSIARDAGAALLCLGLCGARLGARAPLRALAALGALEAALVLAQAAGLDPLASLAPHAGGRLRAYGTLGNPDFAAAWLGASLWLAAAEAWAARLPKARWAWVAAAVLQVVALSSLRSFGSLLGLAAGALFAATALRARTRAPGSGPTPSASAALAAALLAGCALWAGVAARPAGRALEGRLHLWATGAQALGGLPLFGHGPGSVALLQPGWEADRFASGAAGERQRPFAGAQDHLHQDLLERALEQGPAGAALFALLVAAGLAAALRAARDARLASSAASLAAAGAAIASLAARGLVDFPAARPAELGLLVTLIALAARADRGPAALPVSSSPQTSRPLPVLGSLR